MSIAKVVTAVLSFEKYTPFVCGFTWNMLSGKQHLPISSFETLFSVSALQFASLTSNMKKWLTKDGADVSEDVSSVAEFKVSDDTSIVLLKGSDEK